MVFLFFFQAEDGIRDHCVTGVQTCALPISTARASSRRRSPRSCRRRATSSSCMTARSEERRVGKECRSRWSPYHYKQKRDDRSGDVSDLLRGEGTAIDEESLVVELVHLLRGEPPHARAWLFFFSSRRRHTISLCDWSSDVCSSD